MHGMHLIWSGMWAKIQSNVRLNAIVIDSIYTSACSAGMQRPTNRIESSRYSRDLYILLQGNGMNGPAVYNHSIIPSIDISATVCVGLQAVRNHMLVLFR